MKKYKLNERDYLRHQNFNRLISFIHSTRYGWVVNKIKNKASENKNKTIKILDIGSGHSLIIEYLIKENLNFEYIGIEPCKTYYSYAKKKYKNYKNINLINKKIEQVINDFVDIDIYLALESLGALTENELHNLIDNISIKDFKLFLCTVSNEIGPALLLKNIGSFLMRYERHKQYTLKNTLNSTFYRFHKNPPHKSTYVNFNWKNLLYKLHQKMNIMSIGKNPFNFIPSEISPSIYLEATKRK